MIYQHPGIENSYPCIPGEFVNTDGLQVIVNRNTGFITVSDVDPDSDIIASVYDNSHDSESWAKVQEYIQHIINFLSNRK